MGKRRSSKRRFQNKGKYYKKKNKPNSKYGRCCEESLPEGGIAHNVSSPQTFFNQRSGLATATSLPHFSQEIPDNRKSSMQSSVNSACLSAVILLEIPLSTPGSSTGSFITTSPSQPVVQSLVKSDSSWSHTDAESPSKMVSVKVPTEDSVTLQSSPIQKSTDSSPVVDKKITSTTLVKPADDAAYKSSTELPNAAEEECGTNEEYEIEELLSRRLWNGTWQYLVKWKGYEECESTWVPREDLNCDFLLCRFEGGKVPPTPHQQFRGEKIGRWYVSSEEDTE